MKILSAKKFSETVKRYREENGLTIEELGNATGLNKNIIQRIEYGGFIPTIFQYECLASTLDLKLDDLTQVKDLSHSFTELANQVQTPAEKEGLERFIQMMIALRQQTYLRKSFNSESS